MQSGNTFQRNPGLDLMRSIALFMVLFGHSLQLFLVVFPKVAYLSHLMRNAIELFFSLSGFLIGNIIIRLFSGTGNNTKKLLSFYRRRWFRTLPLYYFGIGVNLFAGIVITGNYHDFNWKFLFFIHNLREAAFYFFPVSYSLAIEEWFYLLFPLLLLLFLKLFKLGIAQTMLLLSVCYIIGGVLLRYWIYSEPFQHWDSDFRKTLIGRVDASTYGILVSILFHRFRAIFTKYRWHFFVTGIVLYIISMYVYLFHYESVFNYVWYFTCIPLGAALLIPCFYVFPLRNTRMVKIVTWSSLVSFAFYIVHLNPVMEIIVMYFQPGNWISAISAFLLFTIVSLGLAHVLNKYIEKPLLELGTGKRSG